MDLLFGRIYARIRHIFGLDVRSLAFFRFFFGLVIVQSLLERMDYLEYHHTDNGVLRRQDVISMNRYGGTILLHTANGTYLFQFCLFMFHIVVALLLSIGYKSRLMAFIQSILYTSLSRSAPIYSNAGDAMCCVISFCSFFLPLGKVCLN